MLDNKVILITGGTGSFGNQFISTVLTQYRPKKVIVYSRDELKQSEMQQVWPDNGVNPIRYFIGDVRDLPRLKRAFEGVDMVIHAAAFKQVPAAEYNPFEAVKTNILGGQNVIEAAMDTGVKTVVSLSSDKAVAPINLYGATKLAADKLFVAANNYKGLKDIKFSVFRYGNVMGSRGSVIPFFLKMRSKGRLPVTDTRMTRFNITLQESVDFVIRHLRYMQGGEVFVPKIPSYRITDLVEAIEPECKIDVIGMRPGEKLHEELITKNDAMSTIEYEDCFVILPSRAQAKEYKIGDNGHWGRFCDDDFCYTSDTNQHFLTVSELRYLIENQMGIPTTSSNVLVDEVIQVDKAECKTDGR